MILEATDAAVHCLQGSPTIARILTMRQHPNHERALLTQRELFVMYLFLTSPMEA